MARKRFKAKVISVGHQGTEYIHRTHSQNKDPQIKYEIKPYLSSSAL